MRDLNDMITFAKVVEMRSFSGAARALGVPKSNVSHRVARLEELLGVRLLQRSTRRVGLTAVGEVYYHYCSRIVAVVDEANTAVCNQQGIPRGLLRISMPVAFGQYFMAAIIVNFLVHYPDIRVKLLLTDRNTDLIEEGFDVAVRMGRLAESSLIARRLGVVQQHLYVSPAYLATHDTPQALDDLEKLDCLALTTHEGPTCWKITENGKEKVVTFLPRATSNDPMTLLSMVSGGLGIAMIPDILCQPGKTDAQLIRLCPKWIGPSIDCSALYPSHRGVTPALRTFIDFTIQKFSDASLFK